MTTIAQTVHDAQELICKLGDGCCGPGWHEWLKIRYPNEGHKLTFQYPKSLGELCLELAEDGLRYWAIRFDNTIHGDVKAEFTPEGKRDIASLRQAMYHRNRR